MATPETITAVMLQMLKEIQEQWWADQEKFHKLGELDKKFE